jgi:hypothetical protein
LKGSNVFSFSQNVFFSFSAFTNRKTSHTTYLIYHSFLSIHPQHNINSPQQLLSAPLPFSTLSSVKLFLYCKHNYKMLRNKYNPTSLSLQGCKLERDLKSNKIHKLDYEELSCSVCCVKNKKLSL